ncbi:EAL domain-containing protein [Nitrobacter winogradskyi]|uniref:Diguanylate phosphodiesterase n=2 Tax=Nitrobacter winogradskyi TaxID=913 RepID=A0A4Y3W9G7_NITWI|nr:EAL domain-containing protein [Nitrobacter winogradskyi]MCP1999265.1 cyclic-di-GMP phosphodiesterase TipF (flagellum assembly factor) [Nitrobacter winogradskyi]GEC14549.1 diguanylate phosphodiesterase [Nitrobacter winogradskyi]
MIRISTIFIALCMVLVSISVGIVLYSLVGLRASECAVVTLAVLTVLILYNAVSMRMRGRSTAEGQIADLSRGVADLARQVSDFGRRLAAAESKIVQANSAASNRNQSGLQSALGEINELGGLVKQLAAMVAAHDDMLTALPSAASAPAVEPAPPARPSDREVLARAISAPPAIIRTTASSARSHNDAQTLATIKNAIETNGVDLFLQPIVTLPQRKVRYYEAMTRLRNAGGAYLAAGDFIPAAESAGLMGKLDNTVLSRCTQVLQRLHARNKDAGLFCNIAVASLGNRETFGQCLDILEANRALASSLILEFKYNTLRGLGTTESEHLAALAQLGCRFSVDHVTTLRIEPRELADRGVRFIKMPASLLLDPKQTSTSDIHPADMSDLLGRFGIDLIAERIEDEKAVVDLLDYNVRFGQGFLFAVPRPLRQEAAEEPADKAKPRASGPAGTNTQGGVIKTEHSPRVTGNAALARRSGDAA